jgi:hypothetical protein
LDNRLAKALQQFDMARDGKKIDCSGPTDLKHSIPDATNIHPLWSSEDQVCPSQMASVNTRLPESEVCGRRVSRDSGRLTFRETLDLEISALLNSRSRESGHEWRNHTISPN